MWEGGWAQAPWAADKVRPELRGTGPGHGRAAETCSGRGRMRQDCGRSAPGWPGLTPHYDAREAKRCTDVTRPAPGPVAEQDLRPPAPSGTCTGPLPRLCLSPCSFLGLADPHHPIRPQGGRTSPLSKAQLRCPPLPLGSPWGLSPSRLSGPLGLASQLPGGCW